MKKMMFNDRYGLTKAVLEGRKTMTRRVITKEIVSYYCNRWLLEGNERCYNYALTYSAYQKGEVVAIAQNYKDANVTLLDYLKATDNKGKGYDKGCSNKEFVKADLMPYHIRITNIRVERLQDISDEDCYREGVYEFGDSYNHERETYWEDNDGEGHSTPQFAFARLIDKVGKKGTWNSNPWVFVYSFELVD